MAADSTIRREVGVTESQATSLLQCGLELEPAKEPLGVTSGAHMCFQKAQVMLLAMGSGEPLEQHT